MFTKFKRLGAVVVIGALLGALCAPTAAWARGEGRGGAGGGGGGNGGGRSANGGGGGGGRSASAAVGGNRGSAAFNNGGNQNFSGGHSAGYRGVNAAAGRANTANAAAGSNFSSRHFNGNANSNIGAGGANANRYGAYGGAGPYGTGYGGLGYGMGAGGLGYGLGYPLFGMYGMGGLGMMGMGGYGGGGGYGGNAGGYAATPAMNAPQTAALPNEDQIAAAESFDAKGEADFKAGNYQLAVQDWQHALVDTPHNGGAMLLLAQGLFATGQYQPAAGAVQLGMQMLPQDQWGNVVKHYADLYPNNDDFSHQLAALETARKANPNDPALRFLLGYQYGYLDYPTQAIAEFDKGIALRPQDRGAVTMRNLFAAQAGVPAILVPAMPTAPSNPAPQTSSTTR